MVEAVVLVPDKEGAVIPAVFYEADSVTEPSFPDNVYGSRPGQSLNYRLEQQGINPHKLSEILKRTPHSLRESLLRTERERIMKSLAEVDQELMGIDRPGRLPKGMRLPTR